MKAAKMNALKNTKTELIRKIAMMTTTGHVPETRLMRRSTLPRCKMAKTTWMTTKMMPAAMTMILIWIRKMMIATMG